MKKKCCKCKLIKDTTEFNKLSKTKDGLNYKCRECSKKQYKKHYDSNGKAVLEKCRAWKKNNSSKVTDTRFKRLYGITLKQRDAIAKKQGNLCRGCLKEVKLVVDHNHTTGHVRGLLCQPCNRGLGLLKDSIEIISRLKEYLEESEKSVDSI